MRMTCEDGQYNGFHGFHPTEITVKLGLVGEEFSYCFTGSTLSITKCGLLTASQCQVIHERNGGNMHNLYWELEKRPAIVEALCEMLPKEKLTTRWNYWDGRGYYKILKANQKVLELIAESWNLPAPVF